MPGPRPVNSEAGSQTAAEVGTEGSGDAAPNVRRKRRALQLIVLVAVLVTVTSLLATGWIRSPQQRRAEAAPPALTVLTAPVEYRVLKDTVIVRGQVGAGGTIEVTPTARDGGRAVLTGVRTKAGAGIASGTVLLEVAGRPLIALPGRIPVYRDLRPGAEGKDVAQLQRALRALGRPSPDNSGVFGNGTKTALEAFYRDLGYDAATTGEDDARAVADAASGVRKAKRTLSEAVDERDRLRAAGKRTSSAEALREADRAVRYAREDLAELQANLAALERRSGPMLPMSEVVFLPSFPARVEKLNGAVGQDVKAPLITLSGGELVVQAKLNPAQRTLLDVGMTVAVNSELTGDSFMGSVSSIGALRQDDTGARNHQLVVKTKKPLPAAMAGADVRLTVEAASTDDEVLVVPVSAIFASADGQTAVQKQRPDGTSERVIVTVGVSGGGYTAIKPVNGGLENGDQVILGEAAK
ncbi:peptidoglycan-binding protein [Actinoplanes sp. NPDC051346]|uniref:peptidoglycan-binding protein n=1 Tax=Actinoplanes sp. NPDC051346 TaxID=3155048 RepID=UPI003441F0E0